MRMSIERMIIENFKGTRHLSIDFADTTTKIFGMNGTGKTTIPDAFCWVLFNKDSHGNAPGTSNFREKPLDENGQEIHNLDTTVELICKLDGLAFNLKRTQRESWVKKRGSVQATYTGNSSTYWINDVETALKDFKARISEIASEEIFRLIGSLSAFNGQDWKKRREQLLALAGSDVDGQLLSSDQYRPLADECQQRNISIDDLRKVLADQKRRANTELSMIPIRIDEAKKALPVFGPDEVSTAEYIIKENQQSIATVDGMIAEERARSGQASNAGQIAALEQEAASLTRQITNDWAEGKRQLDRRREEASADFQRASELYTAAENRKNIIKGQIETATKLRDSLREEYNAVRSAVYQDNVTTVCPTCGQPIPEERVEAARVNAQQAFSAERKMKLTGIKERGTDAAKEVEDAEAALGKVEAEIKDLMLKVSAAAECRDEVSELIKAYPKEPDYSTNPRIEEIRNQVAELRKNQEKTPEEKIALLEKRKRELEENQRRHREVIAKRDAAVQTQMRITALEAQQKEYGQRVAELEQLIVLAERFITDRCAALEESINDCFKTVRWKLFDIQVNGGITDVCTCMIPCDTGLVDYESANTAAQVNADLEIINVLSEHYGVRLPLFVDNSERVNILRGTDSQLITLSVSTDSELTVKEA